MILKNSDSIWTEDKWKSLCNICYCVYVRHLDKNASYVWIMQKVAATGSNQVRIFRHNSPEFSMKEAKLKLWIKSQFVQQCLFAQFWTEVWLAGHVKNKIVALEIIKNHKMYQSVISNILKTYKCNMDWHSEK